MSYVPARTATPGDAVAIQSGGWLATRAQRRAARDITRIRIRGAVVTAREITKVEAVADVAESALLSASEVSSLEAALVQRNPQARGRLELIADSASSAMADVVIRTGRNL
jgi:hypothetical protein